MIHGYQQISCHTLDRTQHNSAILIILSSIIRALTLSTMCFKFLCFTFQRYTEISEFHVTYWMETQLVAGPWAPHNDFQSSQVALFFFSICLFDCWYFQWFDTSKKSRHTLGVLEPSKALDLSLLSQKQPSWTSWPDKGRSLTCTLSAN